MKTLIRNGHIVNPADGTDGIFDILIDNSTISKVAKDIDAKADNAIDASGKIVMPGIVDIHVHLREPGREDKETIASGTLAAAKGGVTSCLAMPNTTPSIDSAVTVGLLKNIIQKSAVINVCIAGCMTAARKSENLTNIQGLQRSGAIAVSDDGSSVENDSLMLRILETTKECGILPVCHCEDHGLSANGVVNMGLTSTRLGLRGLSSESEYKRVQRDIDLARKAEAKIHIQHVSTKESVKIIEQAKLQGVKVTAEATPHHFSLNEEAVLNYNTNMKMNPPLRSKEDQQAIKEALKSGVIDCIASDHAPHTINEKAIEFARAEFGVVGLETILSVSISELIASGLFDWIKLVEALCLNPARILSIDKGDISTGKDADLIIVDPEKKWIVDAASFLSKSKNSCFLGKELTGLVEHTFYAGKEIYSIENNA